MVPERGPRRAGGSSANAATIRLLLPQHDLGLKLRCCLPRWRPVDKHAPPSRRRAADADPQPSVDRLPVVPVEHRTVEWFFNPNRPSVFRRVGNPADRRSAGGRTHRPQKLPATYAGM